MPFMILKGIRRTAYDSLLPRTDFVLHLSKVTMIFAWGAGGGFYLQKRTGCPPPVSKNFLTATPCPSRADGQPWLSTCGPPAPESAVPLRSPPGAPSGCGAPVPSMRERATDASPGTAARLRVSRGVLTRHRGPGRTRQCLRAWGEGAGSAPLSKPPRVMSTCGEV